MFKSERKVDRLNRVHGITTSRVPIISTKTAGEGWWNTVAQNHEYFDPTLLFAVLFAVLWATDHKLWGYSYMTRDWWTFGAFVVVYIVFAPAFMQEKDKAKKTPVFKKAMVFITIIAVILAFTDGIENPFGAKNEAKVAQQTEQVAPQSLARIVEPIIAGDRFAYKSIPDGVSIEFFCPSGTLMDFTYNGIPEEEKGFIDCDMGGKDLVLGAWKTGRRIGFMSKDAFPKRATVTTIARGS